MRKMSARVDKKLYLQTTLDILELLGTSRSLSIAMCLRYDYNSLLCENKHLLDIDPLIYLYDSSGASMYKSDAQAIALFKKNNILVPSTDVREELAIKRFFEIEEANRSFNLSGPKGRTSQYNSICYYARQIISYVLGPFCLDKVINDISFSSGASYSLTAKESTIVGKLSNQVDVTPHALPYLLQVFGKYDALARCFTDTGIKTVSGNAYRLVPKDIMKHRAIAKEPLGNMILQKSVGTYIRKNFRKLGLDLNNNDKFHHHLLKNWGLTMATIDQSDASDMISFKLVKDLVDPDWFVFLNRIRSRTIELPDGRLIETERFMTQGNGFTFELESLIFFAIATAGIMYHYNTSAKQTFVSVFGDDIIVFADKAWAVRDSLELCGLVVNKKKSYDSGPFRESCGFDIFCTKEVRPTYLKEFSDGIFGLYELYNRVCETLHSNNLIHIDNYPSSRPGRRILSLIKERDRCFGPSDLGDSVLHSTRRPEYCKYEWGVLKVRTLQRRYRKRCYHTPEGRRVLAYALLGYRSEGVLIRNSKAYPQFRWACPVNWTNNVA